MVASIDGRIDCAMVEKISGDEYYAALEELDCPSLLEGRVTMEHYNAAPEPFVPAVDKPVGHVSTFMAEESDAYMVSVDTWGRLRWKSNSIDGVPLVCIVSENASEEYLETLRSQEISWIAAGKGRIDLAKALEILYEQFGVRRLGLLGGRTYQRRLPGGGADRRGEPPAGAGHRRPRGRDLTLRRHFRQRPHARKAPAGAGEAAGQRRDMAAL